MMVLFGAVLLTALSVGSTPADAQEGVSLEEFSGRLEMRFEVFAGGSGVAAAEIGISRDGREILARLQTEPMGLVGLFSSNRHTLESVTIMDGQSVVPQFTFVHRDFGNRAKTTSVDYTARPVVVVDVPERAPETAIPDAVLAETFDPLALALDLIAVAGNGGTVCEGRRQVYDGRRVIALEAVEAGESALDESRRNIYSGPTRTCRVRVDGVAGDLSDEPESFWNRDAEDRTVLLHFAQVLPGAPIVPVRVQGRTRRGAFLVHLTEIEVIPQATLEFRHLVR